MSTLTEAPATVRLADLPAVGLAELVAQAGLQTRVDRKYLIDADLVPSVLADLDGRAAVLEIDGRREFAYRSTYFDTPGLDAFHLAGRGRRRRFKVRTRVYRDSGETWLEVKTRGPRGTTVKDRTGYELADAGRLTVAATQFVAATLAERGVDDVDVAALRPSLHSGYTRSTLLLADQARATIDTGLTWRRPSAGALSSGPETPSVSLAGQVIIETKGGATPSDMDRALWRHGVRPSQVSKYGAGLAVLTSDLPELKWHRVLTRLQTASA